MDLFFLSSTRIITTLRRQSSFSPLCQSFLVFILKFYKSRLSIIYKSSSSIFSRHQTIKKCVWIVHNSEKEMKENRNIKPIVVKMNLLLHRRHSFFFFISFCVSCDRVSIISVFNILWIYDGAKEFYFMKISVKIANDWNLLKE